MRNSNQQPPKYGAEGPPGGAEAWNQQRFNQAQGGKKNLFSNIGGMIAGMNPQALQQLQERRQQMSQPRPWDQVPRAQWPGQGGGPPQGGMAPSPQGEPPQAQMPQSSTGWAGMQMPSQSQATQAAGQPQLPQQTGMAGLGQAARGVYNRARVGALRGGGGRGMPGNMQEQ